MKSLKNMWKQKRGSCYLLGGTENWIQLETDTFIDVQTWVNKQLTTEIELEQFL